MILGLKYKLVTFTFGGARHQFLTRTLSAPISSLRAWSACLKGPFQIWNFYAQLSIRLRNWFVCSGYVLVPDANAQRTRPFLTRMLRVRISPWCVSSACFEGTALLKIGLSIRVRNFAAPNEPLNIYIYKNFKSQSRSPVETLWCNNHENPSDRNLTLGNHDVGLLVCYFSIPGGLATFFFTQNTSSSLVLTVHTYSTTQNVDNTVYCTCEAGLAVNGISLFACPLYAT